MELEQWLKVYQAASVTASSKERAYWIVFSVCLLANFLLLFVLLSTDEFTLGFVGGFGNVPVGTRALDTGLAFLGLLLSLFWLVILERLEREKALWSGLLRQVEGEFAGAEFHRAELRLSRGQPVRALTTTALYNEWYPEILRLSWFSRTLPSFLGSFLPVYFLFGWLLLSLLPWILV